MSTDDAMELTVNVVDDTWSFVCREHAIHRTGLGERHARNVEAKHIRDHHAPVSAVLNISALADYVLDQVHHRDANVAWSAWKALTGVQDTQAAVELAGEFAGRDVTAAVVPF